MLDLNGDSIRSLETLFPCVAFGYAGHSRSLGRSTPVPRTEATHDTIKSKKTVSSRLSSVTDVAVWTFLRTPCRDVLGGICVRVEGKGWPSIYACYLRIKKEHLSPEVLLPNILTLMK